MHIKSEILEISFETEDPEFEMLRSKILAALKRRQSLFPEEEGYPTEHINPEMLQYCTTLPGFRPKYLN